MVLLYSYFGKWRNNLFFICISFFNPVQDNNFSGEDNDSIDWDTEDELEIQEIPDTTFSSCTNLTNVGHHTVSAHGEVTALILYSLPSDISSH